VRFCRIQTVPLALVQSFIFGGCTAEQEAWGIDYSNVPLEEAEVQGNLPERPRHRLEETPKVLDGKRPR
jgi:hypothetical protein